jgi:hypothetical protein
LFYGGISINDIENWSLLFDGQWFDLACPTLKKINIEDFDLCNKCLPRISLINITINRLINKPKSLEQRIELGKTINTYLDYAQQYYKLSNNNDLLTFVYQALTIHPHFDQHPMIQEVLNAMMFDNVLDKELTYFQRQSMIGKDKWLKILTDIKSWKKKIRTYS